MTGSLFLFYMFSGVLLAASAGVILARNTVHSVFFLILTFLNGAGLFILAQAEFLGMILMIVYGGAVAVLFLFVVMMLNNGTQQDSYPPRPLSLGVIGSVGGILLMELGVMGVKWRTSPEAVEMIFAPLGSLSNTEALGLILYREYVLIFQGAGLILLIAMVGAILLTLRHREDIHRQRIPDQIARKPKDTLRLVEISRGN